MALKSKNKNNKNSGKVANTPRKPGRARKRRQAGRDSQCGETLCQAICRGSLRYPTLSAARAVHFEEVTRFLVTTNADGDAAVLIQPGSIPHLYNLATLIGSVVSSWNTANTSSNQVSINAEFSNYAVLSAAVEGTYISSTLNNAGRLALKGYRNSEVSGTTAIAANPRAYGESAATSSYLRLADHCHLVAVPGDSRAYDPHIPTISSVECQRGWGRFMLFIAGAEPSTAVMEIVVRQQLLLYPDEGSFTARLAEAPVPSNPYLRGRIDAAYAKLNEEGNSMGGGRFTHAMDRIWKIVSPVLSDVDWGQVAGVLIPPVTRMITG